MNKNAKIYVAGHRGMVGSAIVRELKRQGYDNIFTRTHDELDLIRQADVEKFFAAKKPEYVFWAAALGWTYKTELRHSIKLAYEDFLRIAPPLRSLKFDSRNNLYQLKLLITPAAERCVA